MALIHPNPRSSAEDIARALDPQVRGAELVALAAHRDLAVRAVIAGRADAPMATLISLAHETDARILDALVGNPASPPWVIRALATERRASIREAAIARLRAIEARSA